MANHEFVVDSFNHEINATLAAITSAPTSVLNYDATAEVDVDLQDIKDSFKFQSDSFDIDDVSNTDIKYYVHTPANSMRMGVSSSWNPMKDTEVAAQSGLETWGATSTTNSNGQVYALKGPDADYPRHLAWVCFGTPYGVDLFNNELALRENLDASMNGKIQDKLAAAENANPMLNSDSAASGNVTKALLEQMVYSCKERFQSLVDTSGEQSLPFLAGDSISFLVVVKGHANQTDITGASNVRLAGEQLANHATSPLNRCDKVYKIKLNIV